MQAIVWKVPAPVVVRKVRCNILLVPWFAAYHGIDEAEVALVTVDLVHLILQPSCAGEQSCTAKTFMAFIIARKQWLQEQRIKHSVGEHFSIHAGRTCTRAGKGIVHRCWHDGVDIAMTS